MGSGMSKKAIIAKNKACKNCGTARRTNRTKKR